MSKEMTLVGMSGGVDSSVAAFLLLQAGIPCAGATMLLCDGLMPEIPDTATADAQSVAQKLGIPFHVFDQRENFRNEVVAPFIRCYEEGGTPNPCIFCNRHLKFDAFYQNALSVGCSKVATGHYAQIRKDPGTGRYLLCRGADRSKDQSYFLAGLTQAQLSCTLFPLGELSKADVRQIAQEQGFLNARKRDSQDICFIPDGDYFSFMQRYTGKTYPEGDYLDTEGNVVGKHKSAVAYTIGQRKGLGIAMGEPVYVCAKDMEKNTVTLSRDDALFRAELLADDWNWIAIPALTESIRVTAKIRYRHNEQPATVYPEENGFARVVFDTPQRAITTGQAVVLYQDDVVVGGGTIREVL